MPITPLHRLHFLPRDLYRRSLSLFLPLLIVPVLGAEAVGVVQGA
jgi:hypothetical protein